MTTNIYRQAKQLLDKRDTGGEISWEELQLIKTAELPLILRGCPLPEDMPLAECLEELAKSVERANKPEKPRQGEREPLYKSNPANRSEPGSRRNPKAASEPRFKRNP